MEIAAVQKKVNHRIVATAFHGEPPTKEHVVDHMDTNKRNEQDQKIYDGFNKTGKCIA